MDFARIIEADMEELGLHLEALDPFSSLEAFYGHFILAYQRANHEAIANLTKEAPTHFADHPEWEELDAALQLRAALRKREVGEDLLERGLKAAGKGSRWRGELLILAGTGHTLAGRHIEARAIFAQSIVAFEEIGAKRKALKSRLNVLVANSHLDSRTNIIPQYFDLHRRALKIKDSATASICLLNISREYELMGTMQAALKYATESIHLAEDNFGTQHYFLCLVHRAHLLCEMNRYKEARVDYECAVASAFPEVLAALKVLKPKLEANFPDMAAETLPVEGKPEHLLPTWRARRGSSEGLALSPLESQLLEFLGDGPKDKIQILEHLYGEKLDHDVKLNRFKSLIGNLRRKSPDILVNERGHYRLADAIHQPKPKRKKS